MKTIEFDAESYQLYLDEIKSLEAEKRSLLLDLGSSDSKVIDNWIPNKNIQIVHNKLRMVEARLKQLKSFNAVLKKEASNSDIITVGNVYKTSITYSDGETIEKTFKLVTAFPKCEVAENEIQRISISSPIGSAINGKEIGGTYKFKVGSETSSITVIEKVEESQSEA